MKRIFFLMLIVIIIAGCNGISSLNNTYNQAQSKVIVDNKDLHPTISKSPYIPDFFNGSAPKHSYFILFNLLQVYKEHS